MRVLVTGDRAYRDRDRMNAVLDKLHGEVGIDVIIQGNASGADTLAADWADSRGVLCERDRYTPNTEAFGSFAPNQRNQAMIDEGRPDLVIAFPGDRGTRDMVTRAVKAGVEVVHIAP